MKAIFGHTARFLSAAMSLAVLSLFATSGSWAQEKAGTSAKQLVGHWTLVSNVNERDGKKTEVFGPNPKGLFIYDSSGRYAILLFRANLPKIASNNRETATAEENKAIVQGSLAHFGTYTVNEKEGTFTIRPQGGTFPNWIGADQLRKFSITGDELKITNPSPSVGGGTSYLILKRAK
jgi:lipocalin-like protein